jgi:Protein of unknown function (DUF2786)
MSKANRERRRAKEKARGQHRARQTGFVRPPGDGALSPAELAELLISEAVRALFGRDDAGFRHWADQLTVHPSVTGSQSADRSLAAFLRRGVTSAWRRGWQPADLVRFTGRGLGRRHVRLVTDVIAAEMAAYAAATVDERWEAQLTAIGARIWWDGDNRHLQEWAAREGIDRPAMVVCALELLHLLNALPELAPLGPPPGRARRDAPAARPAQAVDQRMLGRVRALLAKAESTEFPEEAEALSGRAQELMARHSIDHALLAAESDTPEEPIGRRLPIDNPYEAPKAVLLDHVADANRCRAVWHRELGFSTVLGFPSDLDAVELLFTSLLVQATTALVHAGSRQDASGRSSTRSFRHSFLSAYAQRIGERLEEATGAAVRQAAAATGRDLLPVLAAREESVDQVVTTLFPKLTRHRVGSASNYEGWAAGRAAADLASLNARSEVTGD